MKNIFIAILLALSASAFSQVPVGKKHYMGARGGFALNMQRKTYEAENGAYSAKPSFTTFAVYKYMHKHLYASLELGITQRGHRFKPAKQAPEIPRVTDYAITTVGFTANIGVATGKGGYLFVGTGLDVPINSRLIERPLSDRDIPSVKLDEKNRVMPLAGIGTGYQIPVGKVFIPVEVRYDMVFDTYKNKGVYTLIGDNGSFKPMYHCLSFSTGLLF